MSVPRESAVKSEKRKRRVVSIALGDGIQYGIMGAGVTAAVVILATATSKSFKKFTSVSAKVSFPIMAGMALFSYNFEVTMSNASLYPDEWGITEFVESGSSKLIPKHYSSINYLYSHPLGTGVLLSSPFIFNAIKQQIRLPQNNGLLNNLRHSRGPLFAGFATLSIVTVSLMQMKSRFGYLV